MFTNSMRPACAGSVIGRPPVGGSTAYVLVDRPSRPNSSVVGLDVVRQAGELALDIPIPPEAADRALPSAAHRLVGLAVRLVTGGDLSLEVAVLGLDDFVVVLAVVLDVAGAAELLAGHGLHAWQGTAAGPWGLLES